MTKPEVLEVKIAEDVSFGKGCRVVMPSNMYGCKIGDDCFIGPFVEIQRGAEIGNRTKIESHSFVCDMVKIGDDCFIGHGVMFTNDRFRLGKPAYTERAAWEKTVIGNNVTIGSGAVLLPVNVCDYVIIGAGAVVTKDITRPGVYVGNPAKYLKEHPLRSGE